MNNNQLYLTLIVATFWVVSCNQTELLPTNEGVAILTNETTVTPTNEELTPSTIVAAVTQTNEIPNTPSNLPTATVETFGFNEFIGLIHPPLPESKIARPGAGALISSSTLLDAWAIHTVKGDEYMLWFSKLVSRSQQGKASFQVSDVVIITPPVEDYVISVNSCDFNLAYDPEIVVMAKGELISPNSPIDNSTIVSVWRANRSTGKFETLTTENIECWADLFLDWP